jgi:hypothetical protein
MVFLTLIASLLLAATSWAAPVFERELVVVASPLQVYNALTVDSRRCVAVDIFTRTAP